jgi:hypothetical protein
MESKSNIFSVIMVLEMTSDYWWEKDYELMGIIDRMLIDDAGTKGR